MSQWHCEKNARGERKKQAQSPPLNATITMKLKICESNEMRNFTSTVSQEIVRHNFSIPLALPCWG
jgi:hypothetical protein